MFLEASAVVTGGLVVVPHLVAGGFVAACDWAGRLLGADVARRRRRAVRLGGAVLAWVLVIALIAAGGVLRRFDATPPPFAVLAFAVAVAGIAVPCSPLGTLLVRGVPIWALVGFHVFRFPLELVMHRAYVEGVMPVQMSYSGRNYDIVTGLTAAALAVWLVRGQVPRWVVASWNVFGLALLVNIVAIAVASTPMFAWFGKQQLNVFVTYPPFVWLPAVLVPAALTGHIVLWRRLSGTSVAGTGASHGRVQPTGSARG
jgi:hypothetical protein